MNPSDDLSGREKNENPITPEKAMPVAHVLQEYIFINDFRCGCQYGGKLNLTRQILTSYNKRPMDLLEATCQNCGAQYKFYFDISRVVSITGSTMGEIYEQRSEGKLTGEAHSKASRHGYARFANRIKNILGKIR